MAYYKKAKEYHPDVNKSRDAAKKFAQIGEAFDALKDENVRRAHRRSMEEAAVHGATPGDVSRPRARTSSSGVAWSSGSGYDIDFDEDSYVYSDSSFADEYDREWAAFQRAVHSTFDEGFPDGSHPFFVRNRPPDQFKHAHRQRAHSKRSGRASHVSGGFHQYRRRASANAAGDGKQAHRGRRRATATASDMGSIFTFDNRRVSSEYVLDLGLFDDCVTGTTTYRGSRSGNHRSKNKKKKKKR